MPTRNAEHGALLPWSNALIGGSEFLTRQTFAKATSVTVKRIQREGYLSGFLSHSQNSFHTATSQEIVEATIKREYVLRNQPATEQFLMAHRAAVPFLSKAVTELRASFGDDVVLTLEALTEDHEPTSLYAIVIWRGDPASAESALEDFDERWLLNQTPQPGITFTYELS